MTSATQQTAPPSPSELDRAAHLEAIIALCPDGVVSFDLQGRVRFLNQAFVRLTHMEADTLLGMDEQAFSDRISACSDPQSPFQGIAALRTATGKGAAQREMVAMRTRDQRVLQLSLQCTATETGTGSVSQVLYVRDITHETETDRIKSEFFSTAAHELRTPMASIYGFSEVLLTETLDAAQQREFQEIIHRESATLAHMLDELLDLARIEARRGSDFHCARCSVQDMLADMLQSFTPPPGRSIPLWAVPDGPVDILVDAGKLRQAIAQVLANAYAFSPAGGLVTVQAHTESSPDAMPMVRIDIADTGIGMTEQQASRVGTRFYRAATSNQMSGPGLGMCIVKEILGLLDGHVSIQSTPGKGTCVSLYLPVHTATDESPVA